MALKYFVLAVVFAVSAFAQGNLGGFTGTVVDTTNSFSP